MSDSITAISLADARKIEREVKDLLNRPQPDKPAALAILNRFRAMLFDDFAKHGDNRIRGICAMVSSLNKLVE